MSHAAMMGIKPEHRLEVYQQFYFCYLTAQYNCDGAETARMAKSLEFLRHEWQLDPEEVRRAADETRERVRTIRMFVQRMCRH